MNLRSLDLNLLVIFDGLMTERSITRAASRIGMTPSAVSHALRRLRDTFQDPLIERTPDGMVPTRRGLDLQKRVHGALADIARAVDQQQVFDPATSERTFKIRTTDYLVCCLLPRVCTRARAEAPNATLIIEYIGEDGDMREEPGDLLLRLYAGSPDAEHAQYRLLQDRLVVAMRRDHPAAGEPMSLDLFVSVPQVRVSTAAIGANLVDDKLAKRGLQRRVVLMIPTLAAVMPIIEHTDLWAVLPERWVDVYGNPTRITSAPLPLPEIEFTMDLVWQRRDEPDGGHRWLREIIQQEFAILYSAPASQLKHEADRPDFLDHFPITGRS